MIYLVKKFLSTNVVEHPDDSDFPVRMRSPVYLLVAFELVADPLAHPALVRVEHLNDIDNFSVFLGALHWFVLIQLNDFKIVVIDDIFLCSLG